jgi:hypothetical protein
MTEFLGLVHGWVWNKYFLCYDYLGLYWKYYKCSRLPPNPPVLRRIGYWSGFKSFLRGLHWDRRRH